MFADANLRAGEFARHVVVSHRMLDGTVGSGNGTYFAVNEDGWALTAAHVFEPQVKFDQDRAAVAEHDAEIAAINEVADAGKRRARRRKLDRRINPKTTMRNISYWWGHDQIRFERVQTSGAARDLAAVKLVGVPDGFFGGYPTFRRDVPPGTSVLRYGFPFAEIAMTWNDAQGGFEIGQGTQLPAFPNDGIVTRILRDTSTSEEAWIIETSTPGLRGQSGGPLLDKEGRVCGMQSRTNSLRLGFRSLDQYVNEKGKTVNVDEEAYLHVGLATHSHSIENFLTDQGIEIDIA